MNPCENPNAATLRFIDLFCGIGGFRCAMEAATKRLAIRAECVFSSDIDSECQRAYAANFDERPVGDITQVDAATIPDHDCLLAGFPCQPFSIIGNKKGFEDARGTLFFDIARILEAKRPRLFVLENVKQLVGHNRGQTIRRIMDTLRELGYTADYRVYNALDFGLPQKRERVWIVGSLGATSLPWPEEGKRPMRSLSRILEKEPLKKYFASKRIRDKRWSALSPELFSSPTIWHENKSGHISAYPYSCALRAGASHNYLLVNGERRLTPREMLRLQGFPEDYKIACTDHQTRRQAGNSLPVNVATAVIEAALKAAGAALFAKTSGS